jgi:parallel beta-helix repeat protein
MLIIAPANAATTCTFTTSGKTMKLQADCTTDQTLLIPNGFLLDGQHHTITAVDPPGDHFRGAVVKNGGAVAKVKDLGVTVSGLADICDADADRLRGILFEGASGSIQKSVVLGINQGPSGCQEGNGIEVRNAPFDGTHPNTLRVTIADNEVRNYQKTGIIANGDVTVDVKENTVVGLGPVNYIAQNGIQLGFGALGKVDNNDVSANIYTPQTFASGGILLSLVGNGVSVRANKVLTSDVGIWLLGGANATIINNVVQQSTFDGIALDDSFGPVTGSRVEKSRSNNNDIGISIYGSAATNNVITNNSATGNTIGFVISSGATNNTLSRNTARNNSQNGINVAADGNTITNNIARPNGTLDIENNGINAYTNNKCNTSSGPPVDCGTTPAPLAPARRATPGSVHTSQPFE